ncbi:MAG: tetratricopeptide repeat protein [Candidatus Aminicenantes bacterium]|jgi:predicted negative regulator of RcsB-dependent stress response
MKRKTRHQLKEDKFQKTITNIVDFSKEHTREISIVGAGVAVLVLAYIVFLFLNAQQIKRENQVLDQIFALSSEIREDSTKIPELEELAGMGKFSRIGYLELAKYWFEKEDFAKATPYLDEIFKGKKDLVFYQAKDLLGQIHIRQENYDEAIALYGELEEKNPKEYILDGILFHKAQAHEKKGEPEEALALYKRLQEEFSQTYYGYDASAKVLDLEEKK